MKTKATCVSRYTYKGRRVPADSWIDFFLNVKIIFIYKGDFLSNVNVSKF